MATLQQRMDDLEYALSRLKEEDELRRWERDMVLITLAALADGAAAATVLDELPRLVQLAAAGRAAKPDRQEAARAATQSHIARIRAVAAAMRVHGKT